MPNTPIQNPKSKIQNCDPPIHNLEAHRHWMRQALELAQAAGDAGEVPVGAVIVDSTGNLIAVGENRKQRDCDPAAHAEIVAIRAAGKVLGNWHLNQCTLYVTLEPCPMCAGAIVHARLGLLVYGADDPKTGAIRTVANIPDSACSNHRLPVLGGILESACRQQLQAWFARRRGSGGADSDRTM
ncbi:tRNA adenosine(34) deaminase TadA [Kamptonema formosum]|uniref:tRNA adenosine(34) deaminase TadA n=1 Tax=Kamptonema formosum TaxID=331992 RepID=UPI00037AA160|nr:tRNA adenosine(34) deaminase TadA [Oscillatoria sp. PCC 10802]